VHPPVAAIEIAHEVDQAHVAGREGIEEPDLDRRVRIQLQERPVETHGVQVVQKEAHPHAAFRRIQHGREQDPPGRVVVPAVVLDIERPLGRAHEPEIGRKGIARMSEETEAGKPRMRRLQRRRTKAQPGSLGIGQAEARLPFDFGKSSGTGDEEHEQAERCGAQRPRPHPQCPPPRGSASQPSARNAMLVI
jgi:hypothetical protein